MNKTQLVSGDLLPKGTLLQTHTSTDSLMFSHTHHRHTQILSTQQTYLLFLLSKWMLFNTYKSKIFDMFHQLFLSQGQVKSFAFH